MNHLSRKFCTATFFLLFFFGTTVLTHAAPLEVSGWIPYWKFKEGSLSAKKNFDKINQIYPFAFSVKLDGTLKDLANLKSKDATKFLKSARANDIKIVPTVMWSSGQEIHNILSSDTLRKKHVKSIGETVREGKFDGIDIDYESKFSRTNAFFSTFLREVKNELKDKKLVCTIEPRTPPSSLYRDVPNTIEYANDYKEIATHCDEVVIMAYDQQRADLKLNNSKKGLPYVPVSDVDWVRKVLELTVLSIPKEKIVLGIPTYGHEYEIVATSEQFSGYKKLWALNPVYGVDTAKDYKIKPKHGKSGEIGFSYFPKDSPYSIIKSLNNPKGSDSSNEVALKALMYAKDTKQPVKFNFVTWSDVEAVRQKVDLAKEFEIRGVSLFKIDGGEDKKIWSLF